jgi:hypothetical protein
MHIAHVSAACAALFLIVAGGGCSSSKDDVAPFTCSLGEATGTWRVHYDTQDGDCGDVPDETVLLTGATDGGGQCSNVTGIVSPDKCRTDVDLNCPTTDSKGTQHWTGVLNQTAAGTISGTMTVQANHPPEGPCRGTYTVTYTRL